MAENEIQGFVAPASWPIRWNTTSGDSVLTATDSSGRFRLEKFADHTVHTVLNATPRDLKKLNGKRGLSMEGGSAFEISFQGSVTGALRAELVLHEFDGKGERLSREVLAVGSAADYVLMVETESLVVSIRTVGQGSLTVQAVEFLPAENTSGLPGLRRTGRAGQDRGSARQEDVLGPLMALRGALYSRVPPTAVLAKREAPVLAERLLSHGHVLEAKAVVEAFDLYAQLSTEYLQRLYGHARKTGYLQCASRCAAEIDARRGSSSEQSLSREVRAKIEFLRDPWAALPDLEEQPSRSADGPVLHVVGMSLPEKQRGYSVRSKYIAETLAAAGIPQLLVVPSGGNGEALAERVVDPSRSTIQLAGPRKAFGNEGAWLEHNVREVYEIVRESRPRVLHAHSDFRNGLIAFAVGRATGIPVVYEVRGFWEESFLSRVAADEGWADEEGAIQVLNAPDTYTYLVNAERGVREAADHVVTLANTMKNHILEASPQMASTKVTLVRNAVVTSAFPFDHGHADSLRHELGITGDDLVIGYVSSLVAHEGVETLVDAYVLLKERQPEMPLKLVIVGDGPHGDALRAHAREKEIKGLVFAGRVQHEEVPDYYQLIDIFVVPRQRTRVTELVTPLKPLEAMSAGKAVIFSDLDPLRELSGYEDNVAEFFQAGSAESLARQLQKLLNDGDRRAELGRTAAEWVRRQADWGHVGNGYLDIYRALPGGNSSCRTKNDPHHG